MEEDSTNEPFALQHELGAPHNANMRPRPNMCRLMLHGYVYMEHALPFVDARGMARHGTAEYAKQLIHSPWTAFVPTANQLRSWCHARSNAVTVKRRTCSWPASLDAANLDKSCCCASALNIMHRCSSIVNLHAVLEKLLPHLLQPFLLQDHVTKARKVPVRRVVRVRVGTLRKLDFRAGHV